MRTAFARGLLRRASKAMPDPGWLVTSFSKPHSAVCTNVPLAPIMCFYPIKNRSRHFRANQVRPFNCVDHIFIFTLWSRRLWGWKWSNSSSRNGGGERGDGSLLTLEAQAAAVVICALTLMVHQSTQAIPFRPQARSCARALLRTPTASMQIPAHRRRSLRRGGRSCGSLCA